MGGGGTEEISPATGSPFFASRGLQPADKWINFKDLFCNGVTQPEIFGTEKRRRIKITCSKMSQEKSAPISEKISLFEKMSGKDDADHQTGESISTIKMPMILTLSCA